MSGNLELVKSTPPADEIAAKLHSHMVGKTVVITGVSPSGIGQEAARVVAAHQPKLLLLASRNPKAVSEVIADIKARAEKAGQKDLAVEAVTLDLGDLKSVRAAAAAVLARTPVVDVLINNAAIMMLPTLETMPDAQGSTVERQFGTNHLGHFLFTNLLMPALRRSQAAHGGARIVNVTSSGYVGSPVVALDDPSLLTDTPANREAYDGFKAYAQSKTATILFTLGLTQRLANKNVLAFSLNPGAVGTTNLSRTVPKGVLQSLGWLLESGEINPDMPFYSTQQAVSNYLEAAYEPDMEKHNGAFIAYCTFVDDVLPYAKDPVSADKLWALSEKLVGEKFQY
ncbi:short chain dehydrogenase reductase [Niveomyces insectorum RCEF 264]|uniref:Short chain dehydrogenase reductase n=1 Tax=Niveomyces insectorum RCEF 264 TaxID=1081102 RepID=A0A167ZU18_9HYPO|nr:short chain dehydrogenase reductase [Niveomyces insectorum RCEF 264]